MYEYFVVSCFASARYNFFCLSVTLPSFDCDKASLLSMILNSMIFVKSLLVASEAPLSRTSKCSIAESHLLSQNSSSARLNKTLGSAPLAFNALWNTSLALVKSLNST